MLGDYDKKSYVFTLKRGESFIDLSLQFFGGKWN